MAEKEIKAKIIEKAWKDPAFKKKLLTNPKATLKEMGLKVPDNVQVTVIEDHTNLVTFVLPPAPSKLRQMSDQELKHLAAAAANWPDWSGPQRGYLAGPDIG